MFCNKLVWKIPRHMESKHSSEEEVEAILKLKKKTTERSESWLLLTRKGDYKANLAAIKDEKSLQILAVRQSKEDNVDYVPCTTCFGFFNPKSLFKHKCKFNTTDSKLSKPLANSRALLGTSLSDGKFNAVHTHILSRMTKRDETFLVMKNDTTLLQFAATQLQCKERDRYGDIKYSLRLLASLLHKYRGVSGFPNAPAKDLVLVNNYDNVLEAAKQICIYEGPRQIQQPNKFRKVGFSLSNLALIVRAIALKEDCKFTIEKVRSFQELYETDWQIYARNAKAVYEEDKGIEPEQLPVEEDVKKFRSYCIKEIQSLVEKSKTDEFSVSDYKSLMKVTLARIMSFNARRGGETSKLKLKHWCGVEDDRWKRRFDLEHIDNITEKKLAERMKLCYVEGKKRCHKGHNLVPILFTSESVEAVRVLVAKRAFAGILSSNCYIFATGEESYLRGWDTLQGITRKIVNLQSPQLITPTRTRKFLATVLQLLDMNEAELNWMTNHMGHSKDVHFAWYRKEDATIELTKVAKVLCAVDRGENLTNKKIDEINQDVSDDESAEIIGEGQGGIEKGNVFSKEESSDKLPSQGTYNMFYNLRYNPFGCYS